MGSRQNLEMVAASPGSSASHPPLDSPGYQDTFSPVMSKAITLLLLFESHIPDTCIHCVGSAINRMHQLRACWSYKGVWKGGREILCS